MRIFISGVMQGSRQDHDIQTQDYRGKIARAFQKHHPEAEVIDPWQMFPDAVTYGPAQAADTLMEELRLAATCDALIAYLPEASMGTSLEMWSAHQASLPIFAITTMNRNWVVQTLSTHVHASLEEFINFVENGKFSSALDEHHTTR